MDERVPVKDHQLLHEVLYGAEAKAFIVEGSKSDKDAAFRETMPAKQERVIILWLSKLVLILKIKFLRESTILQN